MVAAEKYIYHTAFKKKEILPGWINTERKQNKQNKNLKYY